MKKIYSLILMLFCAYFVEAQTNFYFVGTGAANLDGAVYNTTSTGYEKAGVGTYYRSATGGTVTDGTASCDGYTPSKATSSSLFIFSSTSAITGLTVRGTGTGTNRTFSSVTSSTTLNGTYTSIAGASATGAIGSPSSAICGSIVITFGSTIAAGTFVKVTLSGNANVTSLILATVPTITTSVASLSTFTQTGATPSSSQNYTVSGTALTGTTVDLAAPTSYEISTDNATWVTTLSLPVASNIITGQPKTIYARLNDAATGAHTGNITHNSTGASQVNVALNGNTVNTPTITVSPTSLAFGNVFIGSTSAEQTFNVSGVLLTPAADNITITAPTNYEISTTTGTGFGASITLPYTGSTLASTPIYVRLLPTAVATYNGNITNAGGSATTANVAVTGAGVVLQVGDFGSLGSGNWGTTNANWLKWDGTTWVATATAAPTATDNVWIRAGHTVTVEASAKTCKNLIVEGTLTTISTNLVNNPFYIRISGNIFQVNTGGFVGRAATPTGDLADGLGIDVFSNNLTVNGIGGSIYVSRFRTNTANTTVNIDHDMTLNYHGNPPNGGHTIAYYPAAGDNSILNINPGKTLTFAPWACLATTSSSNGLPNLSMTVNINGTLNFDLSPAPNATVQTNNMHIYGGVAAGKLFSFNVGATGVVNAGEIYPNGTTAGGAAGTGADANITVAAGGQLNISKVADFRKPTQTVTGAGAFSLIGSGILRIGSPDGIKATTALGPIQTTTRNYSTTGTYAYEGTTAQVTGDMPSTVGAITLNNAANVTLSNNTTATDSIKFTAGKLILGSNNIITNITKDASATSYTITDGSGKLGLNIGTTPAAYNFPIGPDASTYRPATINFTTAPTATGVLLANAKQGDPGSAGLPLTEAAVTPNSISLVSPLSWEITPQAALAGAFVYDATFTGNGANNVLDFANTTLLKRNDALSNWEILGTHVATTGSNASPVLSRTGLTSFSQFSIGGGAAVLPVRLISFNASIKGTKVELIWSSQNELNLNRYEVEVSSDARAFRKINSVMAYNNSSINNYSAIDNLASTTMFYRLKMIDNDGRFNYSNIVAVNPKKLGTLNVFPNPIVNDLYVSYKTATDNATLTVTNLIGQVIYKTNVIKNSTQTTLQLANLPHGVFNVIYTNGTEKTNTIFVK